MTLFESLGTVSYWNFAATVWPYLSLAVCEIFSVKERRDLENWIRGRSR